MAWNRLRAAELGMWAVLLFVAAPGIAVLTATRQVGTTTDQSAPPASQPPAASAPASAGPNEPAAGPADGFSEPFSGTATQSQSGTLVHFHMSATATGQRDVAIEVDLQLQPGPRGRSTAISNSLLLSDRSGATLCTGEVERLTLDGMAGTCDGMGPYQGERLALEASFDEGLGDQVSGTLEATVVS